MKNINTPHSLNPQGMQTVWQFQQRGEEMATDTITANGHVTGNSPVRSASGAVMGCGDWGTPEPVSLEVTLDSSEGPDRGQLSGRGYPAPGGTQQPFPRGR